MGIDFDELGDVDGPDESVVRDYEIKTKAEVEDEPDVEPHPAAQTLKDFATSVAAKQSPDSAERYYRGVKPLVAYLALEAGVDDPVDASSDQVTDYLHWIANTNWSRNTRESRFTSCQRFYRWAAEDGPLEDNRADDASIDDYTLDPGALEDSRRETAGDDEFKWIRREKVTKLWQRDNIPAPRVRNELLIKLMWYTTCRCRALSEAKIGDDIDREKGRLKVPNLKQGDDQADYRWVLYPKEKLEPLLQQWIDAGRRDAIGPYGAESDYLFLTRQSKKMRPTHISRIVKEAGFNAGIQEVTGYDVHGSPRWLVTGHCIRHSAATHYANNCPSVSINFLKKQLGHSKLETTMQYVHDDEQARRRAFQKAWE